MTRRSVLTGCRCDSGEIQGVSSHHQRWSRLFHTLPMEKWGQFWERRCAHDERDTTHNAMPPETDSKWVKLSGHVLISYWISFVLACNHFILIPSLRKLGLTVGTQHDYDLNPASFDLALSALVIELVHYSNIFSGSNGFEINFRSRYLTPFTRRFAAVLIIVWDQTIRTIRQRWLNMSQSPLSRWGLLPVRTGTIRVIIFVFFLEPNFPWFREWNFTSREDNGQSLKGIYWG